MAELTVEISTYNRKEVLRMSLEHLARQTLPADQFDVVISDDGSTDGTAEMIDAMKEMMPYAIYFFTHHHRGCSQTHNRGITQAKGKIVVMLADDILAEPQLLAEHKRFHDEHPDLKTVMVGHLQQSRQLPQTFFQKSWDRVLNQRFLWGKDHKQLNYINFWVSNLSFKKEFMLTCGMFLDWPAASHEDLELGYRLFQNGMKLLYNPSAVGCHHHAETIKSVAGRAYQQGYNWHHFQGQIKDVYTRLIPGQIVLTDGLFLYLKTKAKNIGRRFFVNDLTYSYFILPILNLGGRIPLPVCLGAFLVRKIAVYNYHKGLTDFGKTTRHADHHSG